MLDNLSMTANSETGDELLLVEEIQHRVVNEYAILVASLNRRAQGCADPIRAFLVETSERLKAFAAVHRALLLPRGEIAVDLGEYLQELCSALTHATLAERGVSLVLYEASVSVEAHRAWRVGLIVSELVTNAVRHGSWKHVGGVIEVEVVSGPATVECRVSDNGGGSIGLASGRGTHIVAALAQEIGGRIHREFNEHGVTVLLTFPCWSTGDTSPSVYTA
ncbi:MAG TPA: sensor histidine kinase [Caulobacteraceae bacterium]|jgi:two-component sensor histidine kinase